MNKIAALTAAALVAAGAIGTTTAQARGGGGAIAAGVIGGLAAGALLGAAVSEAHAAPAYDDGYGRPASPYGYGYGYEAAPVVTYRPAPAFRGDDYEDAPVYRTRRVVRTYEAAPYDDGYRPAGYGWRRHCDRPRAYGGW